MSICSYVAMYIVYACMYYIYISLCVGNIKALSCDTVCLGYTWGGIRN